MSEIVKDIPIRSASEQTTELGNWNLECQQSHILRSRCRCVEGTKCNHCIYSSSLRLPDLPEMCFDRNTLTIVHPKTGCRLTLNCLDALKLVDDKHDILKVSYSKEWLGKRQGNSNIKNTPKPFDWTFSTAYSGTLLDSATHALRVTPTTQEPDQEKLLRRDKIVYHTELVLFEDELADNGSSKLVVKCRVMSSFLLVLLRFYLRVDNVMIRVQETRLYGEAGWDYLLREVSLREASYCDLEHLGTQVLFEENGINKHLTLKSRELSKIDMVEK